MPYTVRLLENEPIVIIDITAPHTAELVKNLTGTIYRVVDMSQSGLTYDQLLFALYEGSRQRKGGVRDERFKSAYVTGKEKWAKLLVESLRQEQYGGNQVDIFSSLEEAIAHMHQLKATPA